MSQISHRNLFIFCLTVFLAYSCGFIYFFGAALDEGSWEHVFGYTRIVIPDTFFYLSIANFKSVPEVLQSSAKNSIAPSLVWWIFQRNWYFVSIFNTICFSLVLIYTRKLVVLLDPSQKAKCYSISLILTFVCMYFSVGSLKEIPTLLGLTAFVYHFLKKEKTSALMWFLFLTSFRFQFSYLIIPIYLLSKIRRNPFRLTLIGLLVVGMFFPLLYTFQVFTPDFVDFIRGQNGVKDSLGSQVEFVRNNILGLSVLAIVIHVSQSILEPLILFLKTSSFYEDGSLSLFQVHSTVVFLLMLRSWVSVLFARFPLIPDSDGRYANLGILYSFLATATFAMGGTGAVSHRFLVPTYGLLLVAAYVKPLKHARSWSKTRAA